MSAGAIPPSRRWNAFRTLIIGTGDTASDCVATALRQGCRSVTQLVRRPRTDYLDAAGKPAAGLRPRRGAGRYRPGSPAVRRQVRAWWRGKAVPLTGVVTTEDTLPCQLLIGATGFAGCERGVCEAFGVEADRTVRTAPGKLCCQCGLAVFAAGDMRRANPGGVGHRRRALRAAEAGPISDRPESGTLHWVNGLSLTQGWRNFRREIFSWVLGYSHIDEKRISPV